MKLSEFLESTSDVNPDVDLVVPVKLPYHTVGGTPQREITSLYRGFDWDHGRLFLIPDGGLSPLTDMEVEEMRQFGSLISSMRGHSFAKEADQNFIRKDWVIKLLEQEGVSKEVIGKIESKRLMWRT